MLVIGGGITGCGVALDAATRGLRTALVERDDFASGTSSKSSKLVHGGPALPAAGRRAARVRGAARAAAAAAQRAPPRRGAAVPDPRAHQGRARSRRRSRRRSGRRCGCTTSPAAPGSASSTGGSAPPPRTPTCPTLPADRLSSGFVYYDASTDDARLTLAIARTAARHGAAVANRCRVVELTHGADGTDRRGDRRHRRPSTHPGAGAASSCRRPACGPTRCTASTTPGTPTTLRPAKGVHVTSRGRSCATTSP